MGYADISKARGYIHRGAEVRIWVDHDEYYPFMTASDKPIWNLPDEKAIEVPDGFMVEYQRVMGAFDALQDELKRLQDIAKATPEDV